MRIISGKNGGIRLVAPAALPVRPTTDLAKTALFNILQQRYNFSDISVLDLFSGTGNISYEFASRYCEDITAVDKHPACIRFMEEVSTRFSFPIKIYRDDVFKFLPNQKRQWDIIFADAPYNMPGIPQLAEQVLALQLLREGGTLVVEHASQQVLKHIAGFQEARVYGSSTFSFFSPII